MSEGRRFQLIENISTGEDLSYYKLFDCHFNDLTQEEKNSIRQDVVADIKQKKDEYRRMYPFRPRRIPRGHMLFPLRHPELISVGEFLDWMGWRIVDVQTDSSQDNTYMFTSFLSILLDCYKQIESCFEYLKFIIQQYRVPINLRFVRYGLSLLNLALVNHLPLQVIEYLLSQGADPFISDRECNALYYALSHPDNAVVELFRPMFPKLVLADKPPINWLLSHYMMPPTIGRVKQLISLGCDPRATYSARLGYHPSPYKPASAFVQLFKTFYQALAPNRIDLGMFLLQYCTDYDAIIYPDGRTILNDLFSINDPECTPLIHMIFRRQAMDKTHSSEYPYLEELDY